MPVKTAVLALVLGVSLTIFLNACGSAERKAEAQSGVPEEASTVAATKAVLQN